MVSQSKNGVVLGLGIIVLIVLESYFPFKLARKSLNSLKTLVIVKLHKFKIDYRNHVSIRYYRVKETTE